MLSRELRIHVDEAKEALATFFESHKGKSDLDATYILIGQPAALAIESHKTSQQLRRKASARRGQAGWIIVDTWLFHRTSSKLP